MVINIFSIIVLLSSMVFYWLRNPVAGFCLLPFFNLMPVIKSIILFASFFSAGDLLLKIFNYKIESKYNCFIKLIIGTQTVIYSVLLMGFAGTLKSIYLYFIIISLVVYNLKIFLRYTYYLIQVVQSFFRESSIFDKFLVLILMLLSFMLISSSFTPVSWFDSLDYHMAVPFKYFRDGQITNFSGNVYSNFPLNAEMINLTAFLFNDELIAKLMIAGHLILLMIVTGMFTYDLSKNLTLSLFSSIFIGSNMIMFKQIIQGNIDLYVTFTFTIVFVYLKQCQLLKKSHFIVIALLLGILVGYKYTAAPLFVVPTFLYLCFKCFKEKKNYRYLFLIPLISLLVFSPWMIKNYMFTGNPLYPFFSWIFKSENWTEIQSIVFNDIHSPKFLNLVGSSWKIFTNFDGALLLLTLFSLKEKNNRLLLLLLYISIIIWGYLSFGKVRYFLPIYPVLISFALYNMRVLFSARFFSFIKFILVLFVLIRVSSMFVLKSGILPYILGVKSTKERLNELSDPYFKGIDFLNKHLSQKDKVLFIGEFRSYPCRFKYSLATLFDKHPLENILNQANSCSHLLDLCLKEGYTHIFFNYLEFQRLQKSYVHHFSEVTGFHFKPESKESLLFFELLNKIKKNNQFPDNLSQYLILYSILEEK